MAKTLLLIGLYGLGLSAILIGGAMAIFGPHLVGSFFNEGLGLSRSAGPIPDLASVNVDSEMRFYALMFVFYGGVMLQSLRDLKRHINRIPVLLAVFFLAGVARSLGYVMIGKPHALFIILMVIELTLPVFLFLCWYFTKRHATVSKFVA